MSSKLRSVNTRFWEDTFVEKLNISEKLLFLYLLTNPQTNLLGIYEISIKRISYDTGLNSDTIKKGFERFGMVRKAYFINDFIILPNFLKNQKLNTNMKIGVAKIFNNLPNWLKENILQTKENEISNDSKGFEMVRNGLVKYEIEIESEEESKKPKYFKLFAHLKITKEENKKLINSGYSQKQIDSIYTKIENFRQNTKYKSLYLTSLDWLKREFPEIKKEGIKKPLNSLEKAAAITKARLEKNG